MKIRRLNIFLLLIILSCNSFNSYSQEKQLKGRVIDETGEGLPGVNILIKNTTEGTITNFEGDYVLNVNIGNILVFSFVGYLSEEIKYNGTARLDIKLKPDIEELEGVVVIGYGRQKKKDLTGSTGLLSSSDVDLQPVQGVGEMLQGKVAGVVVSQNSGAPGSRAQVNIRGFTGNPVYVIDGFIDADINSINQNDIESISILKDASATAIYGSRGANGVILITTKSSSMEDRLKINFDYYHTISQLSKKLDLLDPVSYMKIVNKKLKEGGANEIFSDSDIQEAESTPGYGTDWQDEVFRPAHSDNYDLSFTKGWKNISARVSFGAVNDNGIVENTNYKRYTARLNLKSQITKTTKLVLNLAPAYEKLHNAGNRSSGDNDVVTAATKWAPNLSVIDPFTDDYTGFQGYGATVARNPVYLINEVNKNGINRIINGNLSLEQSLFKDFRIKLFGAGQLVKGENTKFKRYEPATLGSTSFYSYSDKKNTKIQGNIQVDYNKKFGEFHKLNATGVFEVLKREKGSHGYTITDPAPGDIGDPVRSDDFPVKTPEGMMSYLARVGYSYKSKLLLTGSIRADGSSRLPEGNKWDSFLSGAVAYRISEENFMQQLSSVSDMKLRFSYGETGNVNSVQAFQVQDLTNPNVNGYVFNGYIVSKAVGFEDRNNRANPELIWESSKQWNWGMDLLLWDGMVALTTDYYIKYTNDSHFNKPAPHFLGGGSVKTNTGRVKNSGLELQLITKWVSKSDFKFNTSLNITFNQSEVLAIPQDTVHVGNQENGFDRQSHILILGQHVGQLYGYRYLGAKIEGQVPLEGEVPNMQPGDAIYKDINGDGMITLKDMEVIGNGHPDFTWGFNARFAYKKFSLNLFIQGVHGFDVYNIPKHGLLGGGAGVLDATSTLILDSWSIDRNGGLPSLTALYEPQSSLFVEHAGFVRIKNLTLAYEAPEKLRGKLKLSRLRVYAGVQNIFTFTNYTGYDPEAKSGGNLSPAVDRGTFPNPRAFTFGINIGY